MRGTTILLSILMLLLMLKPCPDGYNNDHQEGIAIELDHDHSSDTDDDCPTTCVCSCCGTTFTFDLLNTNIAHTKDIISTEVFSEYSSNYRFDFLSNIWQPPRFIS